MVIGQRLAFSDKSHSAVPALANSLVVSALSGFAAVPALTGSLVVSVLSGSAAVVGVL